MQYIATNSLLTMNRYIRIYYSKQVRTIFPHKKEMHIEDSFVRDWMGGWVCGEWTNFKSF